jgi:hypothetical protein
MRAVKATAVEVPRRCRPDCVCHGSLRREKIQKSRIPTPPPAPGFQVADFSSSEADLNAEAELHEAMPQTPRRAAHDHGALGNGDEDTMCPVVLHALS